MNWFLYDRDLCRERVKGATPFEEQDVVVHYLCCGTQNCNEIYINSNTRWLNERMNDHKWSRF